MRIVTLPTSVAAASAAARFVANALQKTPDLVLALPTGRTAVPMYRALVALHRSGQADFSRATTFNLDEFAGIGADHPGSFHAFMRAHLFAQVNLAAERAHVLNGMARDWRAEVARFEARIEAAGGIDVAVVGIGRNGHIGFNEPAASLVTATHRVRLATPTRRANAWAFGGRLASVPTHALSMGVGTILRARTVVLLATGESKAAIVARALTGPITTRVPGSLLQLHPHALALLDRKAAKGVGL
jgi:glucosamine-6-phosphate deaminase